MHYRTVAFLKNEEFFLKKEKVLFFLKKKRRKELTAHHRAAAGDMAAGEALPHGHRAAGRYFCKYILVMTISANPRQKIAISAKDSIKHPCVRTLNTHLCALHSCAHADSSISKA